MKKSILATTLVAMTVAFSGVAGANEQAITNAYQAINAALAGKDIDQSFSYFAPEYTYGGLDGKIINRLIRKT